MCVQHWLTIYRVGCHTGERAAAGLVTVQAAQLCSRDVAREGVAEVCVDVERCTGPGGA